MCEVIVDYRESSLIRAFGTHIGYTIKSQNLELGDVQIVGNVNGYEIRLLFERKTVSDLAASIVDGRYKEQKARVLSSFPPHMCTYIIEGGRFGAHPEGNLRISKAAYDGAIIHTMYRDKVHVICTDDVHSTARFICSVVDKCMAHPEYFGIATATTIATTTATAEMEVDGSCGDCGNSGDCGDTIDKMVVAVAVAHEQAYASLLKHKSKKKDNIDKLTCYIMQLCQIPGLSYKIAKEIANKYPSYGEFIGALKECSDEASMIKLLKQINMIAEKKAKTIVDFVM
jgi:ERCC4-type nuclease